MSSSNGSRDPRILRNATLADVWMVVASAGLLAGYLSFRTRISNYMHVARWMIDFFRSFLGG